MSETISDTQIRLKAFTEETNPDVDLAPGSVLNELVIKLAATSQNPLINDQLALGQTNSITAALNSTEDTYNPIIDAISSNYGTVRNQGRKATGKLKIVVASSGAFYIKSGAVFTQPVLKLNFVTTSAYTARLTPADGELQLYKNGNLFYFIIPVVAENGGPEYQLSDQSAISTTEQIRDLVEIKSYGSFTSGLAVETDKELLTRIQAGLANKTLLTGNSIKSRLHDSFENFKDVSIVGANDQEMTRSKRNLFGISTLGMVDVYVRTSNGVETTLLTKTAVKGEDGLWSVDFDYTEAAGFYRIIAITPTGTALTGSLLSVQNFDFSTSNLDVVNKVYDKYEARFTKYQTANVTFEYQDPAGATSADFDFLISYQPNVLDIQELFLNGNEQIACADYLVKAALPCYVSIGLKLHRRNAKAEFPADQLKKDIFNHVNNIKFGEHLYVSSIVDICHNYEIKYVELPVKLTGEIFSNHSTIVTVTDNDVLKIPTVADLGISPKTTVFITDYFRTDTDNRLSDAINITVY